MDPTSRASIRAAEKASRLADRQRGDTVRLLMSTSPGRSFVHDKLLSAHVFSTSFSHNALQMAFNEGERNQGLQLLNDVMLFCPEQYILMQREANDRLASASAAERTRSKNANGGVEGPELEDGGEGRDQDLGAGEEARA